MPKVQMSEKKIAWYQFTAKKALHTGSDTTIPSFLAVVVFLLNLPWIFQFQADFIT